MDDHPEEDLIAQRPAILDAEAHFPEFSSLDSPEVYAVRSLNRSALRMLWHQRLGHINFRRLSEMHRFVKGMPQFKIPTELEDGRIFGRAFATKAPPIDWINSWLASNSPQCPDKYVRMDGGGEFGKCRDVHRTFANFGYVVELTGPDSSHQSGPGERPHQTIGDTHRTMLSGANLQPNFWPYAFYHYIRLYNFVPHGNRPSSPYEMCGAPLPNLAKLRTFGCRIHVRPANARYGRVVPNSRLGIFLGYSRSALKVMYYFVLGSSAVMTATHARFDEGMNDLDEPPPNVKLLRNLADDGVVDPDRLDLPLLNLEISDDPFECLDELSPPITCEHPCLGFKIMECCHIRRRGCVSGVVANTTASRIRNVPASDERTFKIVFAPDRYIPFADRHLDQPLHLSVEQLRLVSTILSSSAQLKPPDDGIAFNDKDSNFDDDHAQLLLCSLNTTTHGTPEEQGLESFTRRKIRRLSNWKEWQDAEFKQLDSMAKQEMYGIPVPAPKDAIVLRQHWKYAIKGDGTRKARNCWCDGSPRAAPQLKLANTYSSCIEQPCMRLFFDLCAQEGYSSMKVDATNAYANSPPPNQPTFVVIDDQYADWYLAHHGAVVSREMVFPVEHALQGHPESGALWEKFVNSVIACHGFTSTTHERSLYQGTPNAYLSSS